MKRKFSVLLLFILMVSGSVFSAAYGKKGDEKIRKDDTKPDWVDINMDQLSVLEQIYKEEMTDSGRRNSGWFADGDFSPCTWQGITCKNENITKLTFKNAGYFSEFPKSVLQLQDLKELHIVNALMPGSLPETLFEDLPNLQVLDLRGNLISGSFPEVPYSEGYPLRKLVISDNLVSDSKTQKIYSPEYVELGDYYLGYMAGNLSEPGLEGEFPYDLVAFSSLSEIDLSGNLLYGAIPDEINQLPLQNLNVSNNASDFEISEWLLNVLKEENVEINTEGLSIVGKAEPVLTGDPMTAEIMKMLPAELQSYQDYIEKLVDEQRAQNPYADSDIMLQNVWQRLLSDLDSSNPPEELVNPQTVPGKPEQEPLYIAPTATPAPQWYTATPVPNYSQPYSYPAPPQPYYYPTADPYAYQQPYYYPTADPYAYQQPYYYPTTDPYAYQQPYYYPTADPYAYQQPYTYPTATPYNYQQQYYYPTATPYTYYNPNWIYPTATPDYGYQQIAQYKSPTPEPTVDQASLLGFTYRLEAMTGNNIPMTWRYTGMTEYSINYLDASGNLYPGFAMEWTPATELCNATVCNASVSVPDELLQQGKFSLQLRTRDSAGRTYVSDPVEMEVSVPQPTATPVPEQGRQGSLLAGFFEWLFAPIIRLFSGN